MNYHNAVSFVDNLDEFRYKFGLTRIKKFLKKLGNPQNKLKVIHVAGTNGKGSVCAYISAILQKAGYKVGLYTSPHILDIRERIQIYPALPKGLSREGWVNRKKISKKDFSKFVLHYSFLVPRPSLTYFEFLTAMAFWYFEREKTDFAVVETGLGGRLDATNAIETSIVSVITNISLEHTQYLGSTVGKIAGEKAGIIKNNGVVITAAENTALKIIKNIAKSRKAEIIGIGRGKYKNYRTPLFGGHQKQNMHLAVAACSYLNVPGKHIVEGLKDTYWPGRFEVRHLTAHGSRLTAVLDVAHNPAGMAVLYNSIKSYFGRKINLVFAVLKDKDYKKMIAAISPVVKNVFVSAVKNNRARPPEIIKNEFMRYIPDENIHICSNIKTAVKSAVTRSEDFCVTGSIYAVGEAMMVLKNNP